MKSYSTSLLAIGGARGGIAPCNLLDVQLADGSIIYFADRAITALARITADESAQKVAYLPWLLSVPNITRNRSLTTDTGTFTLQNVSGDTLYRAPAKLLRAHSFEGAFFVWRLWQAAAEGAWEEMHGTLTVDDVADVITLRGLSVPDASQSDTPQEMMCENCQLDWGSKRCGATGTTECNYTFDSCQVQERFMGLVTTINKNYASSSSTPAATTLNRRRRY